MQKTIFITGGGRGIGKTTAILFAKKGWKIGLMDVNPTDLAQVQQEIGKEHCHIFVGDVTKPDTIETALKQFTDAYNGQLNVLFNNAGILHTDGFEQPDLSIHQKIAKVNFIGCINTTYKALPYLKATPNSKIISMGSASSLYGNPEIPVYTATKSAIKSITEGWSLEFEKHSISVSALHPIFVKTKMVTDNYGKMSKLEPKDVKLTPEMVAKTAWKAVHSSKVHWYIGADTKVFEFLLRIVPNGLARWVVKKILKYE